ncbi:hypothetical protein [Pandoraea pulmonicola]|uniref:Uncharacterized protein n=1 Tax=Pandoraea pulmonicola TaxID=93221 RepID=A0AAJ5CZX0_PANPU|nr:hypothetical protein [Pandoraea pulmonicola]AJC21234.1 hypothetical protein RO07_13435 [Pandoraea pulmonicola]SUA90079.1 Uncharacterised protein [Pandoraea pulmonicola]
MLPRRRDANRDAPREAGLAERDQWNLRVSGAQQVMSYLDRFAAHLKDLKAVISRHLVTGGGERQIAERIARTGAAWQQRHAATGGRLNDWLEVGEQDSARRRFRILGLSLDDANREQAETLTFYAGGAGARPVAVHLPAGCDVRTMSAQICGGVARFGLDAQLEAPGKTVFSVDEAHWPSLAHTLRIKGSGVRFPDAEPRPASLESEPSAVAISTWKTGDRDALRSTLASVVAVLERVERTRAQIRTELAEAQSAIAQRSASLDARLAQRNSEDIVGMMRPTNGYHQVAKLAPVVMGISSGRVRALLRLG